MKTRPKREKYPDGAYGDLDYVNALESYCTSLEKQFTPLEEQLNAFEAWYNKEYSPHIHSKAIKEYLIEIPTYTPATPPAEVNYDPNPYDCSIKRR